MVVGTGAYRKITSIHSVGQGQLQKTLTTDFAGGSNFSFGTGKCAEQQKVSDYSNAQCFNN